MSTNGSKTLAAALLAAQAKMPAVEKNADNPFFKSKYTTLDHLLAKALPVLRGEGILVTQWPSIVDGTPALRTRLTHVESGEFEEDVMPLATLKDGPQEQGSCLTYAKRYALSAALCISTEDDDDANSAPKPAPAATATSAAPTGETSSGASAAPSGGSTSFAPPTGERGDNPGNFKVEFGKHATKTIQQIADEDKGYVEWLSRDCKQLPVREAAAAFLNLEDVPFG